MLDLSARATGRLIAEWEAGRDFTVEEMRRTCQLVTGQARDLGELASRSWIMHVQPAPTRDGKRLPVLWSGRRGPPLLETDLPQGGWPETAASPRALRTSVGVAVRVYS